MKNTMGELSILEKDEFLRLSEEIEKEYDTLGEMGFRNSDSIDMYAEKIKAQANRFHKKAMELVRFLMSVYEERNEKGNGK